MSERLLALDSDFGHDCHNDVVILYSNAVGIYIASSKISTRHFFLVSPFVSSNFQPFHVVYSSENEVSKLLSDKTQTIRARKMVDINQNFRFPHNDFRLSRATQERSR